MTSNDIEFVAMQPRDFSVPHEPVNSKGETLAEYIDNVKAVHAALKADLFHTMARKRKAKDVATMQVHDRRIGTLSRALADCRKIASFYGIRLS